MEAFITYLVSILNIKLSLYYRVSELLLYNIPVPLSSKKLKGLILQVEYLHK